MIYLYTILAIILIWVICMAFALCWLRFVDSREVREMKAFIAMNKEPTCDKHVLVADYESAPNISEISCAKCNRIAERIAWLPYTSMTAQIARVNGIVHTLEEM